MRPARATPSAGRISKSCWRVCVWRCGTACGQALDDPIFTVGELQVDLARRNVQIGSAEVHLTPIEHKLLATLIQHAGKVLTHQQLLRQICGPAYTDEAHYPRVYMGQLRHKLESNPARP